MLSACPLALRDTLVTRVKVGQSLSKQVSAMHTYTNTNIFTFNNSYDTMTTTTPLPARVRITTGNNKFVMKLEEHFWSSFRAGSQMSKLTECLIYGIWGKCYFKTCSDSRFRSCAIPSCLKCILSVSLQIFIVIYLQNLQIILPVLQMPVFQSIREAISKVTYKDFRASNSPHSSLKSWNLKG